MSSLLSFADSPVCLSLTVMPAVQMLKRMTLSVIIGNNNKMGVGEDNIASDLHDELLATSDNAHSASADPPPTTLSRNSYDLSSHRQGPLGHQCESTSFNSCVHHWSLTAHGRKLHIHKPTHTLDARKRTSLDNTQELSAYGVASRRLETTKRKTHTRVSDNVAIQSLIQQHTFIRGQRVGMVTYLSLFSYLNELVHDLLKRASPTTVTPFNRQPKPSR